MKRTAFALLLFCILLFAAVPAFATPAEDAAALARSCVQDQIGEYYDNYFYYYTHDEYEQMMADYQGSFGGIGISMINNDDGHVEIYAIIKDSPAEGSPVKPGDIIYAVNGTDALGWTTELAATYIRGEIGSKVTITFQRPDGELYDVTFTRDTIVMESVTGELIEELPHTAYVYLSEFTEQTPTEVMDMLVKLAREGGGVQNLILDLRTNGGGSFWAALNIANYFVEDGDVLVYEKTAEGTQQVPGNNGQLKDTNIVVLVNEYSASASEVLSGALRDEAEAVLVGTNTFGKGITQVMYMLDSGSGVRYTKGKYLNPSGYDLHGVGLAPDVEVPLREDMTSETYWSTDPAVNVYIQTALNQF